MPEVLRIVLSLLGSNFSPSNLSAGKCPREENTEVYTGRMMPWPSDEVCSKRQTLPEKVGNERE